MLPTKEELIKHLHNKMTNQDIAAIYGLSFQKIIQLIKFYDLNSNELRKIEKYIVYEHWMAGEVIYVGSGIWYRCRRYTNRRNKEHRMLMEKGKLTYKIIAEYDEEKEARQHEAALIRKYKKLGFAKFNIKTS